MIHDGLKHVGQLFGCGPQLLNQQNREGMSIRNFMLEEIEVFGSPLSLIRAAGWNPTLASEKGPHFPLTMLVHDHLGMPMLIHPAKSRGNWEGQLSHLHGLVALMRMSEG